LGIFSNQRFKDSKTRTFNNDNGIIRLHDADTARRWLMRFLENVEEDEFHQGDSFYVEGCDQLTVLDAWINITETSWKNVLRTLDIFSEEEFSDTSTISLFRDEPEAAYIQFLNGVVKVTKDDISVIPLGSITDSGAIWESKQIKREIHIENVQRYGLFEKLCERAFQKRKIETKFTEIKDSEFELTEDQYRAMRQAYGYLLHTHKQLDELKAVIFIDSEGTYDNPEGGNGKSLIIGSLKYYKNLVPVDGK
jgi:hypothetical protein